MASNNRQCKKCNAIKSIELFEKRSNCTSGYGYTCKACVNAVNRVKMAHRYYANHEEELQKKREYREANKEIINQRKREARAKIQTEKPKPDIFIPYYQAMLSEVPVDYLKELTGLHLTVKILHVIARRHNIKLGKLTKKVDIIQHLIDNGILSDTAFT